MPELQAAQVMGSTGPAQTDRIDVLVGFQNKTVARVEPPQPGVVYRGVAKLCKTHASSPRPFTFMHLQQALADSRVKARSDNALDLGSLPRVRVLLVAITIRRDAASMARSWGRLILHGWLRPREHILPRKMAFRVGLVELC